MSNSEKQAHYLLVDDDETFLNILSRSLSRNSILCALAYNQKMAIDHMEQHNDIDHAVVDLNLNGDSGLNIIPKLLSLNPDLKIIVLTGYSSIATTVEAMKRGAINYLCKPASAEQIINAFSNDTNNGALNKQSHTQKPSIDRMKWEYIQKTLHENDNNISATARALGMHRRTLQRKLQKKPVFN